MSWRVLYIEESDYLNLYLDNLKIKKGIDETTIPLCDINSIVIDNNKLTITTSLISKCSDYKVNIIICDSYHMPNSIVIPYCSNYQSSLQLRKQLNWDEEIKNIIWKKIVEKKIINQCSILISKNKNHNIIKKILDFSQNVEDGDKTNREGLAAKMYFRELFGKDFKRMKEDNINAGLNYGYSILRSQISREIVSRGLNAHIGLFHNGPGNPFNLSDDIIEVFRPIIDSFVYDNLINNETFNREIRLKLVEITTKKIIIGGTKQTITNAIHLMLNSIINVIETGEIEKLLFPEPIVYE